MMMMMNGLKIKEEEITWNGMGIKKCRVPTDDHSDGDECEKSENEPHRRRHGKEKTTHTETEKSVNGSNVKLEWNCVCLSLPRSRTFFTLSNAPLVFVAFCALICFPSQFHVLLPFHCSFYFLFFWYTLFTAFYSFVCLTYFLITR